MSEACLFLPSDSHFVATDYARGPWDPRHCHGGPVAALLVRAVEQIADDGIAWQIARLTIELTRPVPVQRPLILASHVERPGKRVSLIAAALRDGDVEVARVTALRIRRQAIVLPDGANLADVPSMPPPESGHHERSGWASEHRAFHEDACEHRFVEGSWSVPGPVAVWIRLLVPVVPGEEPSGVQRVVAAADFGNGVSGALPYQRFRYINPDLTVHLLRPPAGEWIGMRAASHYGEEGAGLAESALHDTNGRLGRSIQSLFVEQR